MCIVSKSNQLLVKDEVRVIELVYTAGFCTPYLGYEISELSSSASWKNRVTVVQVAVTVAS